MVSNRNPDPKTSTLPKLLLSAVVSESNLDSDERIVYSSQ